MSFNSTLIGYVNAMGIFFSGYSVSVTFWLGAPEQEEKSIWMDVPCPFYSNVKSDYLLATVD